MTEVDLIRAAAPKSDQLNADDLIGNSRTVRITRVSGNADEKQPISIYFEGDNGKPYKPCKSMVRVLINVWGKVAASFVGKSMTLYRDEKVVFGGLEVGGIRISHMSDMDRDITMSLTKSRSSRQPYTVKRLAGAPPRQENAQAAPPAQAKDDLKAMCVDLSKDIEMANTAFDLANLEWRCNELGEKLLAAGLKASHDKLFGILKDKLAEFAEQTELKP